MRPLLLAVPFLLLTACGQKPPAAGSPPPAPQVGVAAPLAQELPVDRLLTGRLEAVASVELRPRVGGPVMAVLVTDGAVVKAGQPLLTLDPAPYQAALARAEAEVARATAALEQARLAWTRAQDLKTRDAVAQETFDSAKTGVAVAEAALAAAKATRLSADLDLQHTTVTAPIDGRLGRITATVGNVVQASGMAPGTVLGTLVDDRQVDAVVDLDEATWTTLAPRLRSGGVPVRIGLPGDVEPARPATVSFADNVVDPTTGSIRLRARLANPDGALTPGAFVRVALQIAPPRPVLLVHERAILSQLALRYVLVVDAAGATSFRPVQLGAAHGALREVTGLAPTETIAVTNLTRIFFPGMPVAPIPADMATATAIAPAAAPAVKAAP